MNESYKKYITIIYTAIVTLLVCVFAWACDEYYFGKSEEEISKEIMKSAFQADSLLGEIKMLLGDSSVVNK